VVSISLPQLAVKIVLQAFIIVLENVMFLPDDTADCRTRISQKFNLYIFSADKSVFFCGKGLENV